MGRKKRSGCPLYLHASGQWCKTIKGQKVYFGTDLQQALKKYLAEKDFLYAGQKTQRQILSSEPTLKELINVFLDAVRKKVQAGERNQRSYDDYVRSLKNLAGHRGKNDCPSTWTPTDFAEIKKRIAE